MTTYFVDTSALAKRYLNELGSTWVISWLVGSSGNVIIVSELTLVEMSSIFARRVREGTLSLAASSTLMSNFLLHVESEYFVVKIESEILIQARELVRQYPLRTLDAIQLASAVDALTRFKDNITFVSGDVNLLLTASAEGFAIDNPNQHR